LISRAVNSRIPRLNTTSFSSIIDKTNEIFWLIPEILDKHYNGQGRRVHQGEVVQKGVGVTANSNRPRQALTPTDRSNKGRQV
jgi:hypothetical protein